MLVSIWTFLRQIQGTNFFFRIKYEIKMRSLIEYNLLMAFRDQGQIMKIWEKVWIHNYSLPSRLKYLNRNVAMFVFNNLKY